MQISRGIIRGAQKVVIYGPEGIGKSTFASKFPNPLFIDTEGSTKLLDVARTPKPSSWTMLTEQVKYIKANPATCDTLIIDTADWAEQLCIAELCAKSQKSGIEDFGYGKGYVYLAEDFGRLLNLLEDVVEAGINVVITAHAQMRKFEQPDEMGAYDRWELKLQKKTAPLLKEWADMVLFANYKTLVINTDGQGVTKGKNKAQGGRRVMYTTHHPCWDAKNRHDLPLELDLNYEQIKHCIVTSGSSTKPETKPEAPPSPAPEQKAETPPPVPEASQETTQQTTMSLDDIPDSWSNEADEDIGPDIPKPLADLMKANNVAVKEIQQAVASRGYYPADTPISNYDPEFINGVLVGAWSQVYAMVEEARNKAPF